MNINVTVDGVDLNSELDYGYDDEGGRVAKTLGAEVARRIANDLMRSDEYSGLRREVAVLREEEIRAQLKPFVTSALEKGVQKTNGFGEPTGEPTTLRELILAEFNKYLTSKVDSSYRSNGQTVVQKFVTDAVEQVVKKELAAAIAEEKAKVVAAVRAKAAELIAQAVKEGVGR